MNNTVIGKMLFQEPPLFEITQEHLERNRGCEKSHLLFSQPHKLSISHLQEKEERSLFRI